jgi:DNA polymerase-3 subunit epsilon
MRQIVLDTETTGLDPKQGHRIIEVAAIELDGRKVSERHFHRYLNPEREIDAGAAEVHGLTLERLQDEPKFSEIAQGLLEFLGGAELIIHNAPFDVAFLNSELDQAGLDPVTTYCEGVIDTLRVARGLHPGKRNSLDALCERYAIDHSARTLHGALLDTRLLAEVYLAMTRGQESLLMEVETGNAITEAQAVLDGELELIVVRASDDEIALHRRTLDDIEQSADSGCIWNRLETQTSTS